MARAGGRPYGTWSLFGKPALQKTVATLGAVPRMNGLRLHELPLHKLPEGAVFSGGSLTLPRDVTARSNATSAPGDDETAGDPGRELPGVVRQGASAQVVDGVFALRPVQRLPREALHKSLK